jgi:ABC-type uncharacterized transport system substrate-binding protein
MASFAGRLCALFAGILLAGASCQAATIPGYGFQIITDDDTRVTRQIVEDLTVRLRWALTAFIPSSTIYITIGPSALRAQLAKRPDGVIISAYTSGEVFRAIVASAPKSQRSRITALYAEPAPADQFRLIALLYKRPVRIAALLGKNADVLANSLRSQARSEGADLKVDLMAPDDLNLALNRLGNAQVLLAMPDHNVYHTESIRNILLTTYRRNVGVIGFSSDMVNAGALASTYSDIEDINTQLAEMVAEVAGVGTLPQSQYPRYFKVRVNEGIARSLGVQVDEAVLKLARQRPQGRQ